MEAINNKKDIHILYFSFEMASDLLFAKLLSLYLWDKYGQIVSFSEILSLTDKVSDEKFAYIMEAQAWIESVEKYITVIDTPITPKECGRVIRKWNQRFGNFVPMENNQELYIPNNESTIKIVITDHVKLTKDNGNGAKNTIDELCSEYIYYRNKCAITGIFVQQANRQSKAMDRRLNGYNLLQLDDMSDSSGPAQASEVVIGIYYPEREKLTKLGKYNIKKLGDRVRVLQILKNRYGVSDKNICVNFFGEIGLFRELPPADNIVNYDDYLELCPTKSVQKEEHSEDKKDFSFSL